MESLASGLDKVLHILEGNGNPGLVDRVMEIESSSNQRSKDLGELIISTKEISKQLSTLTSSVLEHQRTDNPQHKTITLFFLKSPGELLKWIAGVVLIMYVLESSGALSRIAKLVIGLP